MSSFKSLNLFGSGPHRFAQGRLGTLAIPSYILGGSGSGSTLLGPIELDVVVTGRLVAVSEPALWNLRNAIAAQCQHPSSPGTLVDSRGHSWSNMTFILFEEAPRTDRGRAFSMAYRALFRRLL